MRLAKASSSNQHRSEKAEAILAGAMQEFMAHGYAAASMDRIASVAGVSKPTLYSYFQDKEGLFTALIQRLAQEKFRAIWMPDAAQPLEGEPSCVLRHVANTMVSTVLAKRDLFDFIRVIIGESGRFPELAQTFIKNIDKPLLDALGIYLASRPELRLPDPQATAHIFVGSIVHYLITQELLHGGDLLPMERDRLIASLIHLITGQAAHVVTEPGL